MDAVPAAAKPEQAPRRITSFDIENLKTPLNINGIRYLPDPSPYPGPYIFENLARRYRNEAWFQTLNLEDKNTKTGLEDIENDGDIVMQSREDLFPHLTPEKDGWAFYDQLWKRLIDYYVAYKVKNGKEPEWFAGLDVETQRLLSFEEIWNRHEDFPPAYRFPPLYYGGVNAFAMEGRSMFEDLDDVFNLRRLNNIKQFGYKQDPLPIQHHLRFPLNEMHYSRFRHVYSAAAIANLIGTNLGLSPEDMKILLIAATTHDYRTPAGGDTTKNFVDPDLFDEDKHYNEIFETEEWKDFAKKHGITREQEEKLYRTILGEGVLGKLLDISDKVTYVSSDVDLYLNAPYFANVYRKEREAPTFIKKVDPGYEDIKQITEFDGQVGNIWDLVEIVDGEVVISDGKKLADFLRIRAMMFKELYWSHYSRFFYEVFIGRVTRHLWEQGLVSKEDLLKGVDSTLNGKLGVFLGVGPFRMTWEPETSDIRKFGSIQEAENFARTFNDNPEFIAIVDNLQVTPNSATQSFGVRKDGKVMPFNEAFPEEAARIQGIMNSIKSTNVYVLSFEDLRIYPNFRSKLKEIFRIQ